MADTNPTDPAAHAPRGFSPIQNLLLGQGRLLVETVSDPGRLGEALARLVPGCLPATYADLANVVSKYVRDGLEPLTRPV